MRVISSAIQSLLGIMLFAGYVIPPEEKQVVWRVRAAPTSSSASATRARGSPPPAQSYAPVTAGPFPFPLLSCGREQNGRVDPLTHHSQSVANRSRSRSPNDRRERNARWVRGSPALLLYRGQHPHGNVKRSVVRRYRDRATTVASLRLRVDRPSRGIGPQDQTTTTKPHEHSKR